MTGSTIDPELLFSWLTARSVARGLPMPERDRGGFRVDTGSGQETCRWVFAEPCEGLRALGRGIDEPGYLLKLCGSGGDLLSELPSGWQLQPAGYFMAASIEGASSPWPLPNGYELTLQKYGTVTSVRITAADRSVAASGYAAEAAGVFVYDRIVTAQQHRRQGLGRTMMQALAGNRMAADVPQLLVATEEGRRLYETLGWRVLTPYSTAAIPA